MTIAATAATLVSDLQDAQAQVTTLQNGLTPAAVTAQEPLTSVQMKAVGDMRLALETLALQIGALTRRALEIATAAGNVSF